MVLTGGSLKNTVLSAAGGLLRGGVLAKAFAEFIKGAATPPAKPIAVVTTNSLRVIFFLIVSICP